MRPSIAEQFRKPKLDIWAGFSGFVVGWAGGYDHDAIERPDDPYAGETVSPLYFASSRDAYAAYREAEAVWLLFTASLKARA